MSSERAQTLPTFLVIGAMKAGTSSLHRYVDAHPEVYTSPLREPQFFSQEWDRGLEWYTALFDAAGSARARGEFSTTYSRAPLMPDVPARIAATIPEVRLVYLVREPIERMRSMYVHQRSKGRERRSIDDAIAASPTYLTLSRYGYQAEQYLEHFSPDQLLIVRSEDLRDERRATLDRVFAFIGVDPDVPIQDLAREHNRGADRREYRPGLQRLVRSASSSGAARVLPRPVRRSLARRVGSEVDRPEVSEATRALVRDALVEDARRLAAIAGPDFRVWDAP
jgi:hypothetical protein